MVLFAEGLDLDTAPLKQHQAFVGLWRGLCVRLGVPPPAQILGFTKADIVAMSRSDLVKGTARTPLHLRVGKLFEKAVFDAVVVAVDALPPNQAIIDSSSCLRSEANHILKCFAESEHVPEKIRIDSANLLAHYATAGGVSRGRGRPPRGSIDVIYMHPEFEAVLVASESGLKAALAVAKKHKDWPWNRRRAKSDPKALFAESLGFADGGTSPDRRHSAYRANKHGWAERVVKSLPEKHLRRHPIGARVESVFATGP